MALAILFLSLPIAIGCAIFLAIANRGHIWFRQTRPGLNGRTFTILKFKTMTDDRDESGSLLPDEARLTWIGRFVRAASFDELPQLVNVLRGEMSIVGPRPLLVEYLPLYDGHQSRRHEVRPGITGWAQVNGRNSLAWKERLDLDVWYVENLSFRLDIKILFLTVLKVLKSEGISSDTSATMEKFGGNH